MINPVEDLKVTSKYGVKRKYTTTTGHSRVDVHNGLDLISRTNNDDLFAMWDGKVIYRGTDATGCNKIVTAHGGVLPFGMVLVCVYAHVSAYKRRPGDAIKEGDVVAIMGATGNVTGKHLHLGMYAIPAHTWKKKDGTYYVYSDTNRDLYEINPNEVLHLYKEKEE